MLGESKPLLCMPPRSIPTERETEGLKSGLPVPGESDKEAPRPHRLIQPEGPQPSSSSEPTIWQAQGFL